MTKKYAREFVDSPHPQRSRDWYSERAGVPSASGLGALLETLKNGQPSARSKEYRKQLAFERLFNTTFERFQTKAMADGVFFEEFARLLYAKDKGTTVNLATSYVSDWFVATPDGEIGQDGLLECKVVGDGTFIDIIESGIPSEHFLQIQGQLLATGRDWADYIAVNIKTKAYVIHRVERHDETIQMIYDRLHEPLDLPDLKAEQVKRFDEAVLTDWLEPKQSETIINLPF